MHHAWYHNTIITQFFDLDKKKLSLPNRQIISCQTKPQYYCTITMYWTYHTISHYNFKTYTCIYSELVKVPVKASCGTISLNLLIQNPCFLQHCWIHLTAQYCLISHIPIGQFCLIFSPILFLNCKSYNSYYHILFCFYLPLFILALLLQNLIA